MSGSFLTGPPREAEQGGKGGGSKIRDFDVDSRLRGNDNNCLRNEKEGFVMPAVRITPREAYEKVKGGQALLVCGYEEEEKFKALRLEGAVSFAALLRFAGRPSEERT
jgi:hypothetical protein